MSDRVIIRVASSLGLSDAEVIMAAARTKARTLALEPLAIAIIDSGGQLVAFQREDGCGTARFAIALGKAHAALGMGSSGRALRDRLKNNPAFQNAIAAATEGRFVAVPGGVLIVNASGEAAGAVGISGDTSDADEAVAIHGIVAAGFVSHPSPAADN